MGWTQDFGISVKIKSQFRLFDQVLLEQGRHTGLGAAAGRRFLAQCCHLKRGERREKYA